MVGVGHELKPDYCSSPERSVASARMEAVTRFGICVEMELTPLPDESSVA